MGQGTARVTMYRLLLKCMTCCVICIVHTRQNTVLAMHGLVHISQSVTGFSSIVSSNYKGIITCFIVLRRIFCLSSVVKSVLAISHRRGNRGSSCSPNKVIGGASNTSCSPNFSVGLLFQIFWTTSHTSQ